MGKHDKAKKRSKQKDNDHLKHPVLLLVILLAAALAFTFFVMKKYVEESGRNKPENVENTGSSESEVSRPAIEGGNTEGPSEAAVSGSESGGDISSDPGQPPELSEEEKMELEAAEILESLSLKEKVCQMFIVRPEVFSGADAVAVSGVTKQAANEYPPGGFILFDKNILNSEQLRALNSDLKALFKVPAIISVDEEGGNVVRVANKTALGIKNVGTMGKIGQSKSLEAAKAAGFTIGSYLKEYGFNLDFAPDADVYSNPANKVIGTRSFGSDPNLVSLMVRWCIDGFHDAGMGTTIKHFPGHGDTKGDTHSGYVAVTKTWDELEKTELVPFADNLKTADAIMVAHITLKNALSDGLPASLSRELIQGKLRDEMGYSGLVITDALEMGAIKKNFKGNDAVLKAIEAGNDIILMPSDYKSAVDAVVSAVSDGKISEERIDESVLRILRYKLRYCY